MIEWRPTARAYVMEGRVIDWKLSGGLACTVCKLGVGSGPDIPEIAWTWRPACSCDDAPPTPTRLWLELGAVQGEVAEAVLRCDPWPACSRCGVAWTKRPDVTAQVT